MRRDCSREPNSGKQVGTNQLANAIETFFQASQPVGGLAWTNCFERHGTNTVAVSHIYRELRPLF